MALKFGQSKDTMGEKSPSKTEKPKKKTPMLDKYIKQKGC